MGLQMESDPRGRSSRALIYTLCEKGGRFFRPLPVAAKALQPEAWQATVILPQCQGQLADSQRGAWRRPLGTGNVGTGNAPHPARVLPTESSGPQGTCCSPCTSTPASITGHPPMKDLVPRNGRIMVKETSMF